MKFDNLNDPTQKLVFTLYAELVLLDSLVKDFFECHEERIRNAKIEGKLNE